MVIDIFLIPPLLAELERSFLYARRTQSWDRLRLSVKTLEILECIGNWLRNEHIDVRRLKRELLEMGDDNGDYLLLDEG